MTTARRVLALALVLDVLFGEPPAWLHPVVWMGRALDLLERAAPRTERARGAYGALVALAAPLAWAAAAMAVARFLPWYGQALLLKPTFAGRALLHAAQRVQCELHARRLPEARQTLRSLVSRPTDDLDESLVCAAAIESVAENFVDSWLAPLLMYVLGGLPLAYAYRAANTADAMWGYRTPRYERLGKVAARLDDALNFLPARAGALLLVALGGAPSRAWRMWRTDACRTASPNAGQTMAAAAGALDVRLEKPNHYVLHASGKAPAAEDVARARTLVRRAMVVTGLVCVGLAR